ncbi:MAG: TMEM43 family protein [Oligoflexales bacterium]
MLFHLSKLGRKKAIKKLKNDFATIKMIARFASWFLLAIGISLLFSPLTYFTDFIPFVGKALQTVIFIFSLLVATIICFAIYLTAFIFSSWWITLGVLLAIGSFIYMHLNKQKQKDIKKFSNTIKHELGKSSPQHASLLQSQDQSWTKEDCRVFLKIAGKLVAVDKKVDPGEINFLRNFAKAHQLSIEEANKIVQEGADSPDYDLESIRPEITLKLIQALSDLCLADGYLNDMEYKLMLDICKKTKTSKRKLRSILDQEMLKLVKIYRSQQIKVTI